MVIEGLRALAPDVVALQEVRVVPGRVPNQAETLARACGYHVAFASAATPTATDDWGLAILSRGRVLEQAALDLPDPEPSERRILLSARVETASVPVWVHTTHLNYRLQDGLARERQVQVIDRAVSARAGQTPQVLMGDFNARPEADEIRWLRGLTTLEGRRTYYQDAWALLHPRSEGWTWASANPYTARLAFLEPDRRIDYVFDTPMRRDARGLVHGCRIVLDEPSAEGVFASDHFGVLAEVQITPTAGVA
jgi:endonuclease/exonuclease/phosphatase family metal-dependent hydrolase